MITQDDYEVDIGDKVWVVNYPFEQVIIDFIHYNDHRPDDPIVMVQLQDGCDEPYPVTSEEMFVDHLSCLQRARSKEFGKLKMYGEFVEATQNKIDKLEKTIGQYI